MLYVLRPPLQAIYDPLKLKLYSCTKLLFGLSNTCLVTQIWRLRGKDVVNYQYGPMITGWRSSNKRAFMPLVYELISRFTAMTLHLSHAASVWSVYGNDRTIFFGERSATFTRRRVTRIMTMLQLLLRRLFHFLLFTKVTLVWQLKLGEVVERVASLSFGCVKFRIIPEDYSWE